MPKRRVRSDEEAEASDNAQQIASEEEVVKKSKKSTTKSEKAKAPPSKKQKKGKGTATDGEVKTNEDGAQYVDLGRNRRATVRVFKGTPLIDIREFFGSGEDQKPGKKGISLKVEEWQALKQNMDAIDEMLSSVKAKD